MSRYRATRIPGGGLLQSATRKGSPVRGDESYAAEGLLVRGVVLQVYAVDEEVYPGIDIEGEDRIALFCDVYVYSGTPGMQTGFLPRVLLTSDRGGMHEGDIWIPRATTLDVTGILNPNKGSNPADLDGDHVLVGFMDNKINLPVVLRSIPHPNADTGKTAQGSSAEDLGHRLKIRVADGQPRKWKHRGANWGVDKDGNWLTDLTNAHVGEYNADGSEKDAAEDGTSGNYTIRVQPGANYKIVGPNQEQIDIDDNGRIVIVTDSAKGDQSIELHIDGQVLIDARRSQSKIDMAADGTVTINSGATLKKTTIDASDVQLGTGATQRAIRGDAWQTAHGTYDVALNSLLANLVAVLTLMQTELIIKPTDLLTTAAMTTLLASSVAQLTTIATTMGDPTLKSASVTVKD